MESFSDKFVDCLIVTLHFTRNGIHFDSITGFLRVTNIFSHIRQLDSLMLLILILLIDFITMLQESC